MKNSLQWYLLPSLVLLAGQVVAQSTKNPCLYQNLTRQTTRDALLARYQILYGLNPNKKLPASGQEVVTMIT